ncbi:MFS transporter [Falsirhodobacter halotolerans]|uniref:MFS transporter n=1 Tax=Falsirhodobacter halotolerans TaxID=1146892 RepID=UPI001FD2BD88|nr:MFS transporter [Falsirhodobacter halotolerans]MCJ8140756.1 MFS transporter [Falsirhodobacter halotolerans]
MSDIAFVPRTDLRPGVIHFALALGGFAIGTSEFAAMALIPYISPALDISQATASHLISAYALGVVVGAPVLAALGARLPRRMLLIGLMLVYAIAHVASSTAHSYGGMMLWRFVSGLPHGAYFGVAALMAASVVPRGKRSQAVARVMTGLTVATVLGVPFANILGQTVGWRWGYAVVATLAVLTAILIFRFAPEAEDKRDVSPLGELAALGNRQVLLTLLTGAIGFGGFFAVYSYVASNVIEVTQAGEAAVPPVLAVMGVGMVLGTLIMGRIADLWPVKSTFGIMACSVVLMAIYPWATGSMWTLVPVVLLIGMSGALSIPLQSRLMDVAGNAQTMAAAMNHSAFNTANAIGPALAAVAISAGYGFPSSGYVGVGLSLAGIACFAVTVWDASRSARPAL